MAALTCWVCLVDLEAQLHAGHPAHPQGAEVDAAVPAVDLGDVERAVGAVDAAPAVASLDLAGLVVVLPSTGLGVRVGGGRSVGVPWIS